MIGIDPDSESELLWIAKEGLTTPLPECWRPWFVRNQNVIFLNKTFTISVKMRKISSITLISNQKK